MQKTEIVDSIQSILTNELNLTHIEDIQLHSKLNEDLYLDSVLILQVLISLELKLGIDIPDEALNLKDFDTVDSFSEFILGRVNYKGENGASPKYTDPQEKSGVEIAPAEQTGEQTEEFEDIKVHCFVSCLCECIKANDHVDHRPFYFGVWDADVVVDNDYCINYHAENLNHDFFRHWFEKIYGVEVKSWYNQGLSKSDNINTLLTLLDNKSASQNIMVMLDMYRLPERENKFNQNPFPHYVMLENSQDPEMLFMWDPDFRWEGKQNKKQVLHAIESDAVAGGYIFDSSQIKLSSNQSIHDYFIACLNLKNNPMTDAVRQIVTAHLTPESQLCPSNLSRALTQLPVLAIRKYAYEHGLAYFMLQLNLDFDEFETWCDIIEELVSTYKQIQFRSMKIANYATEGNYPSESSTDIKTEIMQLLDQQDQREFKIKRQLHTLFQQWQNHVAITNKERSNEVCI
ncbi:phosphopantetheine-binding protein [Microbulbifer sp. A4B17]|uniref:DUF6005 family protein n=1 Tax=Microbulbifer sp. A4B17 TaxID=359370 RepID=UPI000D52DC0B|nr:DUF6005 family protein [Microbulbifer sp. A4B17]AWF82742.1 phosphopantetheine-binding protein [Microbulbifer sp. A4B17]